MGLIQESGTRTASNGSGPLTLHADQDFEVGNTVVLQLVYWPASSATITGIEIAGTAAEPDVANTDDGNNHVHIWRGIIEEPDRDDIVFTFNDTGYYVTCGFEERDDIVTDADPVDVTGTSSGDHTANPTVSTSSATTEGPRLVYAAYVDVEGQAGYTGITPASPWEQTFVVFDGQTYEGGTGARLENPEEEAVQTCTWTLTGETINNYKAAIVAYKKKAGVDLVIEPAPGAFAVTGQPVALRAQRKAAAGVGAFALSGVAVALNRAYRLPVSAGAFALTGQPVGLLEQHVVQAAAGAFALSGQPVNLRANRKLAINAGAFTLTGHAINLTHIWRLNAATGAFALTGNAVGLQAQRKVDMSTASFSITGNNVALTLQSSGSLPISAGAFALTGNSIVMRAARAMGAAPGSFSLAGQAVTLSRQYRMAAAVGAFSLSGNDAALTLNAEHDFPVDAGAFALSGQPAALSLVRKIFPAAGAFSVTGSEVTISRDRVLKAGVGSFVFSGQRARLIYSGAPLNTGADRGGISTGISESIWERVA